MPEVVWDNPHAYNSSSELLIDLATLLFLNQQVSTPTRKSNMLKWKYSDADTICEWGEQTQTMDHRLKCPILPQECTTEDLMEYNKTAKERVLQWMNNV